MIRRTWSAAIVTAALGIMSSFSMADSLQLNLSSLGAGDTGLSVGSDNGDVFAGQIGWTVTKALPANIDIPSSFYTYCIDITHNIGVGGTYNFDVESLSDSSFVGSEAAAINDLYARDYSVSPSSDQAAGFQAAIWTLLFPTNVANLGPSLSPQAFADENADLAQVAADLGPGGTPQSPLDYTVAALVADPSAFPDNQAQGQDQALVVFPTGSFSSPVPLPATAGVGFSMLAGFGVLAAARKRLGRRPQIA
jgi:hypothetical protein